MSTETVYSRKNPFLASLTVNQELTREGSLKDTRHFEISLAGSGLSYEVGDSLGVFGSNDPELVEALLAHLGFSGEEIVEAPDGQQKPIRQALISNFIITEPAKQILKAIVEQDPNAGELQDLLDPSARAALEKYLWGTDVLDLLQAFPGVKFTPEEFVKVLRKLQPRLYSIASSQKAVGESVHLTIAIVRYTPEGKDRLRKGVCSTYLAERASEPESIPVFVHTAKHFRLPEDPATPCIMVGPGTGIAPFRAFLQQRAAEKASGKNWLFFGEQHEASEFFYRDEFEKYTADGILTNLTTAFSRDQEYKIYVQHRLTENAEELYKWLEEGAYFYVCGDAKYMAKDVDQALHEIVEKAGGKTPEEAAAYVDELKKAKRYRKDVY